MKKVIYIAGPITGVPRYWEAFEDAEDMRICLAMIDAADAVLFLPGSSRSRGAALEHRYCEYTGKPWARGINELEEALKNGS